MTGARPETYLATLSAELAQSPAERAVLDRAIEMLAFAAEPAVPEPGLRARVLRRLDGPNPPGASLEPPELTHPGR